MAHNINENRMFCVRKCWHDVGVRVEHELTASEAIGKAGLDYEIGLTEVKALDTAISGKKATYRKDNNEVLGIVSDRYKIVQNRTAFDFFDCVVGDGLAKYHSAGALGNGEKIWLLAKLPGSIQIAGDDTVDKYLCLFNSHDGKSALRMYFTPIRVVCQNTLNASLSNHQESISIRHMGNIKSKVDQARKVLQIAEKTYSEIEEKFRFLVKPINSNELENYVNTVLEIKNEPSTRQLNQKNRIITIFESDKRCNLPEIKGTMWSAYNAITQYVDHDSTVRNEDKNPANRAQMLLIGTGAQTKHRALDFAVQMAK